MSKEKRTIKDLLSKKGRIYVYLANSEIGNEFMYRAENEGFVFEDGMKPTSRRYASVMAINNNYTINFVGFIGYMAFGGAKTIGNSKLVRINFEKYINEDEDYYI